MQSIPPNIQRVRNSLVEQLLRSSSGILHLGGHHGQESDVYGALQKPVVWVEAMPRFCEALSSRIEKYPDQKVLQGLLHSESGHTRTFHISNNAKGVSSSLYEFGKYANGENSLWPDLNLQMVETVDLVSTRLDELLDANLVDAQQIDHWVVDLQGAELLALMGAGSYLDACKYLVVEISTVEVYRDAPLWPEVLEFLTEHGFKPMWLPALPHDNVLFAREEALSSPANCFHRDMYLVHNEKRLSHLASLDLELRNKTVLEVGAGIGDHSGFFIDRDCNVLITDARPENVAEAMRRYGNVDKVECAILNMDEPGTPLGRFDLVYCYGLLYHLSKPSAALEYMAKSCSGMLLLETCVTAGDEDAVNLLAEDPGDPSQAISGWGCRPTRPWVFRELEEHFPHVYCTRTQPDHEEFPVDWSATQDHAALTRAIFIASFHPIDNPRLTTSIPERQSRSN
jgi:hypothetical protein